MYDKEADKEARDLFIELRKKCKSPEEIGKAIDKAIDRYFEFKSQKVQLELQF